MEYGGVVGILIMLVLAAMVAVLVHGLWQSAGNRRPGAPAGSDRQPAQLDIFGRQNEVVEYEAVILQNEQGFPVPTLAALVEKMDIETRLNASGFYNFAQSGQLLFYLANGVGEGRMDNVQTTKRLAFVLPLNKVDSPIRGFELMLQASVTVLRELGGALQDSSGKELSRQGIQHLREKVRSWEIRRKGSSTAQ